MGDTAVCIWKWENGGTFPKSANIVKLAEVLTTSVSFLCCGVETPTDFEVAAGNVRADHLRHMIDLARHMIAEAASLPVESVSIHINRLGQDEIKA